jgi:hypothetical protein
MVTGLLYAVSSVLSISYRRGIAGLAETSEKKFKVQSSKFKQRNQRREVQSPKFKVQTKGQRGLFELWVLNFELPRSLRLLRFLRSISACV